MERERINTILVMVIKIYMVIYPAFSHSFLRVYLVFVLPTAYLMLLGLLTRARNLESGLTLILD